MVESCSNCRFSRPANPTTVRCHRRSPAPVPLGQRFEMPTLPPEFWCGEWEKAAAAPRKKVDA